MSEQKPRRFGFLRRNPSEDEMRVWVDPATTQNISAGGGANVLTPPGVVSGTAGAVPGSNSIDADAVLSRKPPHPSSIFYYYDLRTGHVLEGPKGSWQYRLGPYDTPYEAANALEIARERNAQWERQNKAWR